MATTYYSNLFRENAANSDLWAYAGPYGLKAGEIVGVSGDASIPGALTTSDIINLFPMPVGAVLTHYYHWWEDCGGTITAIVQNSTTDMKTGIALGTAQAITAATALSVDELSDGYSANASAATYINLAFSAATTPTAGAKYYFRAAYQMPAA